jgi:hypothetical protein
MNNCVCYDGDDDITDKETQQCEEVLIFYSLLVMLKMKVHKAGHNKASILFMFFQYLL